MAIKSRRIGEQVDRNTLGRIRVANNSGVNIGKGKVVSVVGVSASGGHLAIALADRDGASGIRASGLKFVTDHAIANGATGIVVDWAIIEMDTSALSVGDELWLKDDGSGDLEPLPGPAYPINSPDYNRVVAQVLDVGTDGFVLVAPNAVWRQLSDD
tara:strand:- start:50 stop:520 length:471 start_codon:yes stop_codon:yes gene_type:complete